MTFIRPSGFKPSSLYEFDAMISTAHSLVFPIGEKEVGKLLIKNSKRDIEWEAQRLSYANQINDLMVKFIRVDNMNGYHILVMERIYPMHKSAFSEGEKIVMLASYEEKLTALHQAGFAHCDLGEWAVNKTRILGQGNNICYTPSGIRLVDAGESMLKEDVGNKLFEQACAGDMLSLQGNGLYVADSNPEAISTSNPFRTLLPE